MLSLTPVHDSERKALWGSTTAQNAADNCHAQAHYVSSSLLILDVHLHQVSLSCPVITCDEEKDDCPLISSIKCSWRKSCHVVLCYQPIEPFQLGRSFDVA
jgi:hypothetical protein